MSTGSIVKAVPRAGDDRDSEGYPEGLRNTAEPRQPVNVSTISGGTTPVNAKVDQSNSGNVNHHLPWLMLISMVATAALVMCILGYIYGPRLIRAEFAQDIANLRSDVNRAKQDSAQAKDWTDQKNTELKTLRKAYDR